MSVQLLNASFLKYCDEATALPAHVSLRVGPIDDLYIYHAGARHVYDADEYYGDQRTWIDCEELESISTPVAPPADENEVWDLVGYYPTQGPTSALPVIVSTVPCCFICSVEFQKVTQIMRCPVCAAKMHPVCLAVSMLRDQPDELIPVSGVCPACSDTIRWTNLLSPLRKKAVAKSKAGPLVPSAGSGYSQRGPKVAAPKAPKYKKTTRSSPPRAENDG